MNEKTVERFRSTLRLHRNTLLDWIDTDSPHKDVHLGGIRSDEILQVISELKSALDRIDSGTFGRCKECGEEVEPELLELDFTTNVCLSHYSEDHIRTLENDLELAGKVQRQLLPCCLPILPGVQFAVHSEQARIVGGDYYDFFGNSGNAQGLVIADVMGKGLPASILMSNLQASLRILGKEQDELHTLAGRLNELFRYNLKMIRFISIFLAKIEVNTGILQYCNAGHNPPLWREASSGSIHWLNPTGPAIGLTHNPEFTSNTIQLKSGDLVLLYTDGLIEARNKYNEEFGEERLAEYIRENFQKSADDIMKGLQETALSFADSFHDDMTLMIVKIQ